MARRLLLLVIAFCGLLFLLTLVAALWWGGAGFFGRFAESLVGLLSSPRIENVSGTKPVPLPPGHFRPLVSFEQAPSLRLLEVRGSRAHSLTYDGARRGALLTVTDFGGEPVSLVVKIEPPVLITKNVSVALRMVGEGIDGFGLKLRSANGKKLYTAKIPRYVQHNGWQSYTIAVPTFIPWRYNDRAHVFLKSSLWTDPGVVSRIELTLLPEEGRAAFLLGSLSLR